MNEKIMAILLQLAVSLKESGWITGKDWEITLKGEGHVPLTKQIPVEGELDNQKWSDNIETYIDLKLDSDDQITYFPDYTIYAHITVEGAEPKDIAYKMGGSAAFTEHDVRAKAKVSDAAKKINRLIDTHINHEYQDYIDMNEKRIKMFKMPPSSTTKPPESPRLQEFFTI